MPISYNFPGAADVIDWFGAWPSFHDAEIVSLELNRVGTSILKVHAFSSRTKHAIVSFLLYDIVTIHLDDFNHQNVIFDLKILRNPEGYEILLAPCYGLSGSIVAKQIQVTLEPGIPEGSVYAKDQR
ncbi:Imm50 family immunity protein [Edaphobacter aggregans]|uniref:Imm50 family immunity protein n=1 Tax=Edaphobacter aggregans TaxID=570835 RepID=UPI00068C3582|nr:Imm50 family immunity protein [Edaphobacter aggregans]